MCDTMVALGNSTLSGGTVFAKNSDRSPNERLLMERIPRRQYEADAAVNCTYITIPQVKETYEVLLLRPHWLWGAEMGTNEFGVMIGNEAVFTKEPAGQDALIGMDLLRLALERSRTARQTLDCIVSLLDAHGQGGNCGYGKTFTYDNAYLIADRSTAWVLETAGPYWAAKEVRDVYAISNRLSIGSDYDLAHPDLVRHAMDKGWCRSEADFDFAKCYTNPLITRFSGAANRDHCTRTSLESSKGQISVRSMMDTLRSHTPRYDSKPYRTNSVSSVCMHAGGLVGDQTTGSFIAELAPTTGISAADAPAGHTPDTYWITGGSAPCLSLFKPWWMIERDHLSFTEIEAEEAFAYWEEQEKIHRAVLEQRIDAQAYRQELKQIEDALVEDVSRLAKDKTATDSRRAEIQQAALQKEAELRERTLAAASPQAAYRGSPYFNYYWKKANKDLLSR